MKMKLKKGFTLVEIMIVVAIIAQGDPTAVPGVSDLVGMETTKYIRKASITCPEGGDYTISTAEGSTAITVTCPKAGTLTDHVLK